MSILVRIWAFVCLLGVSALAEVSFSLSIPSGNDAIAL